MFNSPKTAHMDGNPHFANAIEHLEAKHFAEASIEATLALAFEQRTATLVELRSDTRFVAKHIDTVQARIHGGLDL